MTTFNVKASGGVNPHTVMKNRIKPRVWEDYAKPRPNTAANVHGPAFYVSKEEIPKQDRKNVDGPFWVYWPSDKPLPEEYAELEKIVRSNQ